MTNKQVIAMIISIILSVILVELFKWYQKYQQNKEEEKILEYFLMRLIEKKVLQNTYGKKVSLNVEDKKMINKLKNLNTISGNKEIIETFIKAMNEDVKVDVVEINIDGLE